MMKAWVSSLKTQIARWQNRSPKERILFVEAFFWLAFARLALLVLPFRRVAAGLGKHDSAAPDFVQPDLRRSERIGWAVQAAGRRTPWQSACLAQAIAAQKMLRRRGMGGIIYLGVARNPHDPAKLKAHAWVRYDKSILIGKAGCQEFTVVSTFSWPDRRIPVFPDRD